MKQPDRVVSRPNALVDIALRTLVLGGLWWILNEGDAESWFLGAFFVPLAIALSVYLLPPRRWNINLPGALAYVAFFLQKSVLSSIDVASRVLRPSMPLRPGLVRFPLRLQSETARAMLANTASLLPGTLSVDIEGDTLVVHALDQDAAVVEELRTLEERIAGFFGIRLEDDGVS